MTSNGHIPILLKEVTKMLVNDLNGTYVDCTVGLGGHSSSILNKLNKNGFLIGIELDPYALSIAKKKLSNSYKNYSLHNTSYKYFPEILNESGIKKVNGFLFDLGISSYQVDSKHRGFSYLQDESLDMRFNPDIGITAKEYINNISECELINLFKYYSDIRSPKKIASSIIEYRKKKQMNTTFDLKNSICKISNNYKVFSQVFQCIRIGVNDEIETLKSTLKNIGKHLEIGGRVAIITFHSIEDRIIKHFLKNSFIADLENYYNKDEVVLENFKMLTKKPIVPTANEIKNNYRARSAKLRIAERIS